MGAAYKPTERHREKAKTLASVGLSINQIAEAMKISYNTCVTWHKEDMREGRAKGVANIATKVYKQAAAGCRQSQKLYLAQTAGWSDKVTVKGDPNAPIQHEHHHSVTVDASNAIGALMEQLATAKAKGGIIDHEPSLEPLPALPKPDPGLIRLVGVMRSGDSGE